MGRAVWGESRGHGILLRQLGGLRGFLRPKRTAEAVGRTGWVLRPRHFPKAVGRPVWGERPAATAYC